MKRMFVCLSVLCTVFLWIGMLPVEACSPPQPGIHSINIFPASKTTGIPTNSRIIVRMDWVAFGGGSLTVKFQVRTVGGAGVTVTERTQSVGYTRRSFLSFPTPLKPNTDYELLTDLTAIPCNFVGGTPACATGAFRVISTFTTGSGTDTKAPQFAGLKNIKPAAQPSVCTSCGCCGPYNYHNFQMEWDAATDETTPNLVLYNVYEVGNLTKPVLELVPTASGAVVCSGNHFSRSWKNFTARVGDYVVRAVDLAGNEDTNTTSKTLANLCNSSEPVTEAKPEPVNEPSVEPVAEPSVEPVVDASEPVVPEPQKETALETTTPDVREVVKEAPVQEEAVKESTVTKETPQDTSTTDDKAAGGCACSSTVPGYGWLLGLGFFLLVMVRRRRCV